MAEDPPITTVAEAQARLEEADAAVAEGGRLEHRIGETEARLADAERAAAVAVDRLTEETADVRALEGYSPTRIWASLRGERDTDLQREEAERQRAEYDAAAAQRRVEQLRAEVAADRATRRALGNVDLAREQALAAKEALLVAAGGATASELGEVSAGLGRVRAEITELDQAQRAGAAVDAELRVALGLLGKAGDWAAWDTFGGGGMLTDAMKYDRMDEATARLRHCNGLMQRLADELADLSMPGLAGVEVSDSQRMFDVWFDNIFSDWSVRNRIRDAHAGAQAAWHAVQDVGRRLHQRRLAAEAEAARLARRREELLG